MDWLLHFANPSTDWDYASVALVVRFIGVFGTVLFIQLAMQLSSRVVRQLERAQPATGPITPPAPASPPLAPVVQPARLDDATAVAIGLALALEAQEAAQPSTGGPSAWAIAGRMQQLTRQPR